MKKKLSLILSTLLILSATLRSDIIETAHFQEILNYIQPNTIVLLDIDDTLLVPAQTLGTDAWFVSRMKQLEQTGLSRAVCLNKVLPEWHALRLITKVKIVEEGTESVIIKMQKQKIPVMGLTTQGLVLSECTPSQLHLLNINLSITAPYSQDCYFMSGKGVLYHEGILFTSGAHKGKALFQFFDRIGYKPQRILFINDKETHLKEVEVVAQKKGVEFVGLRYSYSDERVKSYSDEIADLQWNLSTFHHLLSDEEAVKMLTFSKD